MLSRASLVMCRTPRTVPQRASRGFYDVNREWAIEAEGVAPDIEVRNDPRPVMEGGDPQLERAVQEALRLLETEAVTLEPEPDPPVRYRRPDRAGSAGGGGR